MMEILKKMTWLSFIVIVIGFIFLYLLKSNVKETIIFFPIDENIMYETAFTSIKDVEKENHTHTIDWKTSSILPEKAFLRQDISLLYNNGRLVDKMGKWEQQTNSLKQEKKLKDIDSGKLESISFHYSEIHRPENEYRSVQQMSSDYLYVVNSSIDSLQSFKQANNSDEKEWKETLDKITKETLNESWKKGFKKFHIQPSHYDPYLLTEMAPYSFQPLKGFSKQQADEIIGKLWEGLYKEYFIKIRKEDGTTIDSIDSTIPLILISKNKDHLLVLFETSEGEPILLRQQIEGSN